MNVRNDRGGGIYPPKADLNAPSAGRDSRERAPRASGRYTAALRVLQLAVLDDTPQAFDAFLGFQLPFAPHRFAAREVGLKVNNRPRPSTFRRTVQSTLMLPESLDEVFAASDVESTARLALEDINEIHT